MYYNLQIAVTSSRGAKARRACAAERAAMDGKEMNWLPEQDEEKLQLGFRIIQNAFKGKVHVF